jgi:hypothetical protein
MILVRVNIWQEFPLVAHIQDKGPLLRPHQHKKLQSKAVTLMHMTRLHPTCASANDPASNMLGMLVRITSGHNTCPKHTWLPHGCDSMPRA